MPAIGIQKVRDSRSASDKALDLLPGLVVVAIVTTAAILLQGTDLFAHKLPMSSLILAILIGIAGGNLVPLPVSTRSGIKFAAKRILRLAIIFLGFKLSIGQIVGIGPEAAASAFLGSSSAILFTLWLGRRMGIPTKRALLLGTGIAVCGAAAVAAVDGVIGAEEEDAAFGISAVTLFGTIYIFLSTPRSGCSRACPTCSTPCGPAARCMRSPRWPRPAQCSPIHSGESRRRSR